VTRLRKVLLLLIFVIAFAPGCVKSIIVQPGEPVQLRETVRAAKVWVFDSKGNRVEAVVDLPAGFYCLSDEK
jgi:DNA mismatch repair protein MutH